MIETNLPILYLREVVLLPFNEIRLEFTEDKEKNILDISMKSYDSNILLINFSLYLIYSFITRKQKNPQKS